MWTNSPPWPPSSACRASPTLIVFKGGQITGQSLGAKPKGAVLDFLRQTGAL